MRRKLSFLLLGLPLMAVMAAPNLLRPPPCHLQVIPDYTLPISYKAVLRLSPQCPVGMALRVRKSSTLNTRREGAPWQPIEPKVGAWEVGATYRRVPDMALWTMTYPKPWRWEWWDVSRQTWAAAEVLHARP